MLNISIVLYNSPYIQVQSLLDSLNLFYQINKIYLIDNSDIKTNSFVGQNIEYIFVGKNIGFGAGHNIALTKSINDKVDYHIVMNYDLKIGEKVINTLISEMDNDKSIGIIMPKVLNDDHSVQLSPKLIPTPLYVLFSAFKPFRILFRSKYEEYTLKNYLVTKLNVPIISGCFGLFRVKVLSEVGLYDDRFFMYFEDDDISRRIHLRYKTIYQPNVFIEHSHHRGATKSLKLFFIFSLSAIKYFNKHGWNFDKTRKQVNKDILESVRKSS